MYIHMCTSLHIFLPPTNILLSTKSVCVSVFYPPTTLTHRDLSLCTFCQCAYVCMYSCACVYMHIHT